MFESSTDTVIPGRRAYGTSFGDVERGPSGEHIRRVNLPTVNFCADTSLTSLDLWYVDLDVSADALCSLKSCLSADELARAERFRSDLARARFIVGRAALRSVLAGRLGCSPAGIRFCYGANGKPILNGDAGNVEFNLAHSEGDAVIALADGAAVGVDIEFRRPIADVESLARLVFSDAELRELAGAPDAMLAFLHGWTRKEAYVKALGLGLTAPLREITVSLSDRAALISAGFRDQSVSNWRFLNVPHPRAIVALALRPRLDSRKDRKDLALCLSPRQFPAINRKSLRVPLHGYANRDLNDSLGKDS